MLSVLMGMTICLAPAQAADVPIVVDALAKTQEAPNDEGAWQITANVKMYSYTRGVGFSNKMDATGLLSAVPDPTNELSGTLAMRVDDGPYFTHKLRLHVARDGKVGIQWLIKNKPYLGRGMEFFQAEASGEDSLVAQGINWNNFKRTLIVTLSTKRVKAGIRPFIRVPVKKPIGKRYKITGFAHTTNSDDGPGDDIIDPKGSVSITSRVNGQDVTTNVLTAYPSLNSWELNHQASLTETTADYIFSDPKSRFIRIDGFLEDYDASSSNDRLWPMMYNGIENKKRVQLDFQVGRGNIAIPGDRNSENVEVYYSVTFVEDLY